MRKCFILFVVVIFCQAAYSQQEYYRFTRLGLSNGLSHNQVNTIHKDSRGFMWFGTMSGLNRYDGYNFKVFKSSPQDTSTIRDNYINNIYPLPDKKLWIVTRNGNCIYDAYTETFSRDDQRYLSSLGLPSEAISTIVMDHEGSFWFLYQNLGGIFRYAPGQGKPVKVISDPGAPEFLSSYDIATIANDAKNNLWVVYRNGLIEKIDKLSLKVIYRTDKLKAFRQGRTGGYSLYVDAEDELWISEYLSTAPGGVFRFNRIGEQLDYLSKQSGSIRLNSNVVSGISQDEEGKIWIGTDHGGINIIDKKNNAVRYLFSEIEDNASIPQNSIYSVYKDDQGVMWFGTYKQGICYYSNQANFVLFKHKFSDTNSLPFEDVNRFAEDANGNLWIGTNGGGLLYFDRRLNTFKAYTHNPSDPNSISNNVIVSLLVDHEQKLWVGTYLGGLNYFDGEKFIHYNNDPSDPGSISNNNIWDIFEDSKRNIWVGTLSGGVSLYNRKTKSFTHYHVEDLKSLHSNYISCIIEDRSGNIWFGASNGIDVLNTTTGAFTYIAHDDSDPASLSNNNVNAILEDSRGYIWVATREGLNRMDKNRERFTVFTTKDGLPDNSVLTILEDNNHNLWMGTPNGLCNAIIEEAGDGEMSVRFVNYDESDGLQGRVFNDKAAFKTKSGELLFGGFYGFNMFSPEKFYFQKEQPRIVLTGLQVFSKPVKPGEKLDGHIILTKSITEAEEITLKYNQNVFSVSFAALGLGYSGKEKFQYMLEGFNKEWLSTDGNQRIITYTNIDPGKYTLQVRQQSDDPAGIQQAASIRIVILPPFWLTIPAFVVYLLLAIGILTLARYLTIRRAKMRFRIAQEKKEAQRVHELDMLKLKFFTNISHEFRTPISLILAPVEKMLKNTGDDTEKKQYQLIYRNGKRLLGLVNQLLDFRKLEMKELRLYQSVGDIVEFTREVSASFSDLAEKKNIDFSFNSSVESLNISFDRDKIERIMFNLLSNAFKFTREEGTVSVNLKGVEPDNVPMVEIQVCDSGIGIPEENREKIFERFFQHENSESVLNNGSGIGLAISREFVKLHGGSIKVDSTPGKGTCFTILLPVKGVLAPQNGMPGHEAIYEKVHRDEDQVLNGNAKRSVLIVEDNDDIRFYIKDNLRNSYIVYQAVNGKEGLEKAIEVLPDLIISDVMMPVMDGISLCRQLKTDPRTSHIPVILLTARTSDEQKMEGYRTGAVDYITKPFSFEMLQSRIHNLLLQQEKMRRLFQNQVEIQPKEISSNPVDEDFITRAVAVVEENISQAVFSVEDLSRSLYMSRVALYKKLLSLTGKAPLDFIRAVRIKKAMQLMRHSRKTISEIAYEVGFNDPKYFARYFKKEIGKLPSEYVLECRKVVSGEM
ncbi:MAG: response regulator [Chitinophagaceae bacterium]|nr:response regulator [Chitinophagaceae bacterium]MCW5927179.1 response regulator [Chitinophagaceae bacterium]